MSTDIFSLLETTESDDNMTILHKKDKIFDFSCPLPERMYALALHHDEHPQTLMEIIKKLNAIYCMSPIAVVRKFLYEIAKYSTLPIELRMECAVTLRDMESSQSLGLECVDVLLSQYISLPIVCRLDFILNFLQHDAYTPKYQEELEELLVRNTSIPIHWRYRQLLALPDHLSLCRKFVDHIQNELEYRILGCQHLFSTEEHRTFAETFLLTLIQNKGIPHRQRADAADVLLHHGQIDTIMAAQETLKELGGQHTTFYDNKENIHMKDIEWSARETIQSLDTLKIEPMPTFDTVTYNLLELAKKKYRERIVVDTCRESQLFNRQTGSCCNRTYDTETVYNREPSETEEKIKTALLRIELDRTTFREVNHSLRSILCVLYAYIQTHESKKELEKRLLEELVDMAGTCTTGYLHRLVNVLSGFGHDLRISWEDQIVSNLNGRLNARLRSRDDWEEVLEQMTNRELENRSAFFKFFRENISVIREEMYQEFQPFMEDLEWDEYFQKAILFYTQ